LAGVSEDVERRPGSDDERDSAREEAGLDGDAITEETALEEPGHNWDEDGKGSEGEGRGGAEEFLGDEGDGRLFGFGGGEGEDDPGDGGVLRDGDQAALVRLAPAGLGRRVVRERSRQQQRFQHASHVISGVRANDCYRARGCRG
jgi:hypothetical protein